ncbi:hypothetical protein ACC760_39045, partial [Rhizobium ruizarguesonis]
VAGFCLDTGHSYYAGMDPVEMIRRYADRLDYIHFKDIYQTVFDRVLGEKIRFFEAAIAGRCRLVEDAFPGGKDWMVDVVHAP